MQQKQQLSLGAGEQEDGSGSPGDDARVVADVFVCVCAYDILQSIWWWTGNMGCSRRAVVHRTIRYMAPVSAAENVRGRNEEPPTKKTNEKTLSNIKRRYSYEYSRI